MHRSRLSLAFLFLAVFVAGPVAAGQGPYLGVDLGASEPLNDNYRAHVQTGATASPYFGMMFNDYLGLQGNAHFLFQEPDNDQRSSLPPSLKAGLDHENRITTMAGLTAGPRLSIPLGDVVELYGIGQGGAFKGMGGRLNQWAPGFSVGGGVDFNLTRNLAVGLFGRWNRAYMAPHPTSLIGHVANDQGPKDARWATAGLSFKVSLARPEAPPPPPPPPAVVQAPPPPVVKKKIVLRNVHFDFNKATIRPDARPVLDEAVQILKTEEPSAAVIVEGHTDSIGSNSYNMKLSHRRADAVRDYLVRGGIAASRIHTEGFGETRPVASNATADGRAQNRRVELHLD